ncbi:MAG TPA: GNAT family N-acetyltransferase [Microlunatus sp.]
MISLRPLAEEDAGWLADWGMDRDFRVAAGWSDRTHDEYRRFCSDHIANGSDDEVMLGVTEQDRLVGYVCFYLDKSKQGCELGIAIGPSSNWSRGYGRQAITSATRYAMIELGAVNVWAQTHPANIAARRMLKAAGYVETDTRGAVEEYRGEAAPLVRYEPSERARDQV